MKAIPSRTGVVGLAPGKTTVRTGRSGLAGRKAIPSRTGLSGLPTWKTIPMRNCLSSLAAWKAVPSRTGLAGLAAWMLLAGAANAGVTADHVLERMRKALGTPSAELAAGWALEGTGEAFRMPAQFRVSREGGDRLSVSISTAVYQVARDVDARGGTERNGWDGMQPEAPGRTRELAPDALARTRAASLFLPFMGPLQPRADAKLEQEDVDGRKAYRVAIKDGSSLFVDAKTFLPFRRDYPTRWDEGAAVSTSRFEDYRAVGGALLPFRIRDAAPDNSRQSISITVASYRPLTEKLPPVARAAAAAALAISLDVAPSRLFKEHDFLVSDSDWEINPAWAISYPATETFTLDLILDEADGRWVEPVSGTAFLEAKGTAFRTVTFSAAELKTTRRTVLSRYSGRAPVSVFRHHFTTPIPAAVDAIRYEMTVRDDEGRTATVSRTFPVTVYDQKTPLIFPIKGNFMAISAHDYDDPSHKDDFGQWGAYDIVALGERFELLNNPAAVPRNEDVYTFEKEIIAPGDGTIVATRDGVPDDTPADLLMQGMSDPVHAMPGNWIMLDHGNGEVSFFCHLRQGSLRVKTGQTVRQGEVIALLGGSQTTGYPHLHYQLQTSADLMRTDGIPARFDNIEFAFPVPGAKVSIPKYGYYLRTTDVGKDAK
ncbi:peptidoglycan DD-metalloendopeptidase family protein [Sphingosinicella microcystinivorans]|uniref:peptidoglycan DD-metalloendopeptidase family protein n=1 Tax=Sphingosinicella microcystinivorans TaxID=335406 RepID=UPI0022F3E600|nr:peptidoglycan DD-metalloendopeptidase family protein [Sphingosinicella microcystinivorans]WBX84528.1 peptidoglycan DD-metalloendopeptidase family protein [Sphingosinicella microcystinivorans]